jgi:hypothetical protein
LAFDPHPSPLPNVGIGHGPGIEPPEVEPRKNGVDRQKLNDPAAANTVHLALQWLQTQQNPDGTWGSDQYRGAFTGLALLCYLGHADTPEGSPEFGVVVSKGIDALVAEGIRNEGRFSFGNGFDGNQAAYEHGICTYALCEAYTMTQDARLVPIIKEAVNYIVKGQRADGGWAYSYDLSPDAAGGTAKSDTSVSGWQVQALRAAHMTRIPGIDKTIGNTLKLAMNNMDRVFNPKDGSFGYRNAGDKPYTLTGVGVLSKMFWMGAPDSMLHKGFKNIESKELNYQGADANLYAWYYDTQACYQAQEGVWNWWGGRFEKQLVKNQSPDGSWPVTGGNEAGGLGTTAGGDGPVYRTTLCCLMMEVNYRYEPVTKETSLRKEIGL